MLVALLLLPGQTGWTQRSGSAAADSVLARSLSFTIQDASIAEALGRLRHDHGIPLAFSGDLFPAKSRISLALEDRPLGTVLAAVLEGTGLTVVVTRDGSVVVVRSAANGGAGAPSALAEAGEMRRALSATGVRQLDEVIVMGTAVAGAPEREQPTAVAVAGPADLAAAAHTRVGDLLRTLIPGVVIWDAGPGAGPPRVTSVRGVSSFTHRGLKTYVDGIELATADFFPLIDGRLVERVEAIRGPQGAALYGPDALNGVLQVETRSGPIGNGTPALWASATGGVHEPGVGGDAGLWQDHAAGLSGGGEAWGASAGGSWSRVGTRGGPSWQQVRTALGGATLLAGPVVLRATGRFGSHEYGLSRPVASPIASIPQEVTDRALGVSLLHAPTAAWRQSLVVGYHRGSGPRDPLRSFLIDPLLPLGATHETASRWSARYGTSLDLGGEARPATLSGGVEYSARRLERSARRDPVGPDLAILYRDQLHSPGAFGQVRIRLADGLVATGGSRAEWSSSVGVTGGAAWASSAGLSWSRSLGLTTLRLRGAWGRALRPPEPGMSRGMATSTIQQEPNDELAPERQSGVEAGVEVFLAGGGWLRATWFHQVADDLMQQVHVRTEGAVRAFQFQNVGAIRNRGAEVEAGARFGALSLAGALHWTSSTVLRIAPRYTGALEVGDALLEVPSSVGTLLARYTAGMVTAEAGISWLGSWTGYDRAAVRAVEAGQRPEPVSLRDFWIAYPGVARPHLAVAIDAGRGVSAFIRADNPTGQGQLLRDNLSPPLGRTTVVGVTIQR